MKRQISWTFLMFLAIPPALNETQNAPVVVTKTGKVQGTRTYYNGTCIDVYYGIPFAKPPVGDLRFQTTVPVGKWDGVLKAIKKVACPQGLLGNEAVDRESVQCEDCLYLNIWAPCNQSGKAAVMVWIYGGSFTQGSASMTIYDGSELVTRGNVVLVNANYRLGVLGFATSKTKDAPGNAGMYDQAEALKWIHDNIECFGGNRSSITLFGQSAGSISVSMHSVSPLTSELFQKIIMESGSSALLISALTSVTNLNATEATAKAVNCSSLTSNIYTNPSGVMDCMRKKDFSLLLNVSKAYQFAPQIGDSFMPKDPRLEIIAGKSKNCDRIIGVTADEGSLFWARKFVQIYGVYGEKNHHPTLNKTEARPMMRKALLDYGILPGASDLIIEHYLKKVQGDNNEEVLRQAYTSVGDSLIRCPCVFEAEKVAQQGNEVYFYMYKHRQTFTNTGQWTGVPHFSEVPFVFGMPLRPREFQMNMNFTEEEKILSRRIIELWTNFAKQGSRDLDFPF